MTLSASDRLRVNKILLDAGFEIEGNATRLEGRVLRMLIKGGKADLLRAQTTLANSPLNMLIDGDLATEESGQIITPGADFNELWVTLNDGGVFK